MDYEGTPTKMLIFEDLRKLFLRQKLNLGFECQLCKNKFYNKADYLEHTRSCKNGNDLKCQKCGKTFGHFRILQLHLKIHSVSESLSLQSSHLEDEKRTSNTVISSPERKESIGNEMDIDTAKETKSALTRVKILDGPNVASNMSGNLNSQAGRTPNSFKIYDTNLPKIKSSHKAKGTPKQAKKQVGLTKIKMEDCLRCDACSCIYIDEKDYYKHMRNFHQKDMNKAPTKQQNRAKRNCQSCCKQCRGSHCIPVKRTRATHQANDIIFRFNMKDNIKTRWTQMVSQQLSDRTISSSSLKEPEFDNIKPDPDANITIKQELEPDLSYLLSQVEVKIKTEPQDDY